MIDLGGELALAGKPLVELIKDVAKEAVVIAVLKMIGMGEAGEPARAEQMPIRIEVVMAGQNTRPDTLLLAVQPGNKANPQGTAALIQGTLAQHGLGEKRFPARTYAVPMPAQKQKAVPALMK